MDTVLSNAFLDDDHDLRVIVNALAFNTHLQEEIDAFVRVRNNTLRKVVDVSQAYDHSLDSVLYGVFFVETTLFV